MDNLWTHGSLRFVQYLSKLFHKSPHACISQYQWSRFTLSGQGLGSGRVMGRGPFLRLENLKTSCGHRLDILWIFIQYLTKICSTLEYCDVHTFSHNCVTWTKGGQKVDTLDISMSLVIVQLLSCFRVTRWQTVKS